LIGLRASLVIWQFLKRIRLRIPEEPLGLCLWRVLLVDFLSQLHGLPCQPRTIMTVKYSVHSLLTFPPVLFAGSTNHLTHLVHLTVHLGAVTESVRLNAGFAMMTLLGARLNRRQYA
jgi:hypothetical protein